MLNETLHHVRAILRDMWHRRWIGITVAWLVALIAIAVVFRIPEKYEATARVHVDTESLLRPALAGLAIQPNFNQQVALLSRTLISRPNVQKVVRMADLDLNLTTDAQRAALVESTMNSIKLGSAAKANIYAISYRSEDRDVALRVVQSLLTIFVESSLGDKQQDSRSAMRFLDEQIRQYEEVLKASENRLKDFRLKYIGVGSRNADFFSRLETAEGEIAAARLQLQIAEQQRDAYQKELAGEQPTLIGATVEAPPVVEAVPEIDARLAQLRRALDEQRRKFTDAHPDVQGTQRIIAELEKERQAELDAKKSAAAAAAASRQPAKPAGVEGNPVFQSLRISLAASEAAIASARAKLAGHERQYAKLKSQASLVPEIENELQQLNRDYDIQKKTYESLLARRGAATMGIGVQDSAGAQFRVIDPPRVSTTPVTPNRLMLLAGALMISLGAGVVAAFVASQLVPTFHDSRSLREVAQRPVVGMVSQLPDARLARRRKVGAALFAGGMTGLLALFAGVAAFAVLTWRAAAS